MPPASSAIACGELVERQDLVGELRLATARGIP